MWAAFKGLSLLSKLGSIFVVLALLAGLFFGGKMLGVQQERENTATKIAIYKSDVKDLQAKLAEGQTKVVTKVITEYRDRVQKVEVDRVVYRDVIKEVPVQYPLSNGWVYVHNSAVAGTIPTEELSRNPAPSGIFDAEALPIIVDNYQICKLNNASHNALIDWVRETLETARVANEN